MARDRTRSYVLPPPVLGRAMLAHVMQLFGPEAPDPQQTQVALPYGLVASVERLWEELGGVITLRGRRNPLQVRLPTLQEMMLWMHEEMQRLNPLAARFFGTVITREEMAAARSQATAQLSCGSLGAGMGSTDYAAAHAVLMQRSTDWPTLFGRFERMPFAEQSELVAIARELAAHEVMLINLSGRMLAPAAPGVADDLSDLFGQLSYISEFLEIFYWEASASPIRAVERFLPPRLRALPRSTPTNPSERGLELDNAAPVARTDPRVDTHRFDFYTVELGCRCVVSPTGWFGDRNYVAFLLRARSGLRLAILDAREYGNAAYVFRIGRHAEGSHREWVNAATSPKDEAREHPRFLRTFSHCVDWEAHVRRFLENN